MLYRTFILLTLFALTSSCSQNQKLSENYFSDFLPPGTVMVNQNFYCDIGEVSNIDWREYTFWVACVYGENSQVYLNTLPKTTVWQNWRREYSETILFDYYTHPAYNDYPIVGISQKQAEDYSKWRSDRVFEQYLIKTKRISVDKAQTPTNHFTIERYYTGQLETYLTDEKLPYYPEYKLPSIAEAAATLNYADSINTSALNSCKTKRCRERELWFNQVICQSEAGTSFPNSYPTSSFLNPYQKQSLWAPKSDRLTHLRGNVGEWMSTQAVSFGGGWKDSLDGIVKSNTFQIEEGNAWTGFRNVCKWQKWEDLTTSK